MTSVELLVVNPSGLHARAAAAFVRVATRFRADVRLANLAAGGRPVNGKSLTSLLTAGASPGQTIRITADGEDEHEAIEALKAAVEGGLGEGSPVSGE